MLGILTTLLPVFALIAIGFVVAKLHLLPEGSGSVLNQFILKLALPALIFAAIASSEPESLVQGGFFAIACFVGMLISFVLLRFFVKKKFHRTNSEGSMLGLVATFPDNVFLGLPVLLALFPGNSDYVLASTLSNMVCLPFMIFVILDCEIARNSSESIDKAKVTIKVTKAMLANPIVISLVLGIIFCLSGIHPKGLITTFRLLGSTTTPCALTALGLVLGTQRVASGEHKSGVLEHLSIHIVKMLIQPAVTWLCLVILGVEGYWLAMGIILSGMPTAFSAYVVSDNYNTCSREASLVIMVNTAASVFTVPLLAIFLRFLSIM